MTELYLTSTDTVVEHEPRPSLLPTPISLFRAPTPLPEKNPEHVCRQCQSSTCDTLLAEFARHAIEPGLPEGVVNDPMLEHGFQEASIVEAQTDITAFVAAYADCPDFHKVYDDIKGLQHQETHDTWPDYSINESGLLMHHDGDNLRVCVPSSQRNLILRVMHDLPLGMHQGTAKMYALMAARFYFPKMAERVRAYVETCEHCQRHKSALIAYEEFLRSFDRLKSSLPVHAGHSKEGYTQTQRTAFKKKLASFIGINGEYSVLGNSDNRRTSKMSAPRGERGQADVRRNGVEDPRVSTTASNSASDTERKQPGFYRV
jgi:hypothetical protein